MKECKVIHINDGTEVTLTNGNRHFAEEMSWAAEMLSMYLNAGYEIQHIIPDFTPGTPDGYPFYKTGFTAFMVREVKEDNVQITPEDWEEKNQPTPDYEYDYPDYDDDEDLLDDDFDDDFDDDEE